MKNIDTLKRLFKDYTKKYLKKIIFSVFLSIIVAGSTASIAWLLDPAIEKIFIEKDKTLILIGFGGGFRRTELVSIDYKDIEFVPEGVKIIIRRSKTDQFGEGMIKGLPYFSNQNYCPVLHLKKWLDLSNITGSTKKVRLGEIHTP